MTLQPAIIVNKTIVFETRYVDVIDKFTYILYSSTITLHYVILYFLIR